MMMNAPHPPLTLAGIGLLATLSFSNVAAQPQQLLRRGVVEVDVAAAPTLNGNMGMTDYDLDPPMDMEFPGESDSLIAMQFTDDPHASRNHMEMILNGELGLASVRFSPSSFDEEEYANVYGEFCAFDASLNKVDPSNYPTIDDVMGDSEHCGEHRYMMDMHEVMDAVEAKGSGALPGGVEMKELPVTGLLFHEGYSGAGLISNALTTFETAHVISEHPALRDALSACDVVKNRYLNPNCTPSAKQSLVKDVVTLLSRTPSADSKLEHLYLKLSSASSAYIPEVRSLFPQAKWAFVLRNAEHALAKATGRVRVKSCLKTKRNPSTALSTKSAENNIDLEGLTHHQVCALHLSSLLDVAAKEVKESGTGKIIPYDSALLHNVDAMTYDILPYFGVGEEIAADPEGVKARIAELMGVRSNAAYRVNPEHKVWSDEEIEVSEEVREASRMYLNDSMDNIVRLRQ